MTSKRRRTTTVGLMIAATAVVSAAWWLSNQRGQRALAAQNEPALEPPDAPQAVAEQAQEVSVVQEVSRPKVDVVFVLDTTGSMGGLIEGAKRKIWAIANQVASGQPRPDVRFGLVGYRDRGDAYVTQIFPLSEDMDDTYAHLVGFSAEGGGDTPEHVNKALADALRKMQWRDGKQVLRQIFLVGDAPPHEGRDGLRSADLAQEAQAKGIVINAVRCGSSDATARAWVRLAQLSDGAYSSIAQDGAMVEIATDYDAKLAALNDELSATMMVAGPAPRRKAAERRARFNRGMSAASKAESAKLKSKTGRLDSADLIGQLERGKKLDAFGASDLPVELAGRDREEQRKIIAQVKNKRRTLKRKIAELSKRRDAYLSTVRSKMKGKDKGFEDSIGEALKVQGARAGIAY